MKLKTLCLATLMLAAVCVTPASALEYTMEAPDDYLFGRPTSDDTIYEWEDPNVDRGKNTALIPPGFGTPTSYLPGSGTALTANLVPGGQRPGISDRERHLSDCGQRRRLEQPGVYRRHQRPLLLRGAPGDAQDPGHRPVRQGVPGDRQQHPCKRRGPFPKHQHLGRKLLYRRAQPGRPG